MKRISALAIALGLGVAGCAADNPGTGAVAVPGTGAVAVAPPSSPTPVVLPTLHRPEPAAFAGMTVRSLIDGTVSRIEIEPHDDGIRVRDAKGCVAERTLDWFAPSYAYAGCGTSDDWSTASGEVRVLDSLYPLAAGSTGKYERRLVSATGEVSMRTTACEVTGTAAVELPGRPAIPAFVVACDDGRITRTTWYAPGVGPVAYREAHETKGVREAWVRME